MQVLKIYQYLIWQKNQKKINCKIIFKKSNDPRSYRLSSDKLEKLGFKKI